MKRKNNLLQILGKVSFGVMLILLLVSGFVEFDNEEHKSYLQTVLDDPQEHDGEAFQVGGPIIKNDEQFLLIRDPVANHDIKVLQDPRFASINVVYDSVTVYGIFKSESSSFIPVKVRIHRFEIFKYIFSIIGAVMFLYIFLKEWKLTWKGFQPKGV